MAVEFDNNFIAGLSAFLIAHLFYLSLFRSFINIRQRTIKVVLCLTITLFSMVMTFLVLPEELVLKVAVTIYICVITLMCWLAIFSSRNQYWLHLAGALVFAISDSIIAWDAFRATIPLASVWIMTSYYLAQLLIVSGIIRLMANALHEKSHKADTSVPEST